MRTLTVALAGNPNVGKSTLFNALTDKHQHTGNWPGKTVGSARGQYRYGGEEVVLVDLPGTYSLTTQSADEVAARDFLCFGHPDAILIIADATCLERSLTLTLQILESTTQPVVLCVNLLDEAAKKQIRLDLKQLEQLLQIPVAGITARDGTGLTQVQQFLQESTVQPSPRDYRIPYAPAVERALRILDPAVAAACGNRCRSRALSLHLLCRDTSYLSAAETAAGGDIAGHSKVQDALARAREALQEAGLSDQELQDQIATAVAQEGTRLARQCVRMDEERSQRKDRLLDRLFTSRATGIPVMLILLALIFYLTLEGANYPSQLLSRWLFALQEPLRSLLRFLPLRVQGALVDGVYRTVAWVISVMLPPMAIFFPLFTLLEDAGYLPRVAFDLDHLFMRSGAHGRQSLTMMMGLGCNACGVTGCRIIDSPRERLIAMLTNALIPCNGRFPTLVAILTMFFTAAAHPHLSSALAALGLLGILLLSVLATLGSSALLSHTLLQGVPSFFSLELPPYRRPQVGKVILRSIGDRTLFVLGRSVLVAAPAGLLIWVLANTGSGDASLLHLCADWLDPFARWLGIDGMILLSFLLGFPANEIVVPILLMGYLSQGSLTGYQDLSSVHALLISQGWTLRTAVCMLILTVFHFPCGTTTLTLYKESRSLGWTFVGWLLPTLLGMLLCFLLCRIW